MHFSQGGKMKLVISSIISLIMGLGAYALVQATLKEREAQAEQCRKAYARMLSEFDAIVGSGKFPTQDQQDEWRNMMQGCEEDQ